MTGGDSSEIRAQVQHRLVEDLATEKRRSRDLLDGLHEIVLECDLDGNLLFANQAWTRELGWSVEDSLGSPIDRYLHPEDCTLWQSLFGIQPGTTVGAQRERLRLHHRDGTTRRFEIMARGMENGRSVISLHDITGRHELEGQLRQAQKMEAVGHLTSGISHDFNNFLTIIMANAELVAESLPNERDDLHELIEDLRSAAQSGCDVIKKLLSFSRRQEFSPERIDVREVLETATHMLRRLLPEYIEIENQVGRSPLVVDADEGALKQVLLNLAMNARDAMPDGGLLGIQLRQVRCGEAGADDHPWVKPGEYACISVSDKGEGMDAATRERIFEPFFTTKPAETGTGVGMAMVYGLMKQHRGYVHVHSEVGQGPTVDLHLPLADQPVSAASAVAEQSKTSRGTKTILVADDEDSLRRAAKRILEKHGYMVYLAADGEEALEIFVAHENEIDLVMSDVTMPNLNGRALYDAICDKRRGVKFLFCSGSSPADIRELEDIADKVPFLEKPWTLTELATRVREVLDDGS